MRHVCHAVDKMGDTRVRFKCATETVCRTGGARMTPIPSQRARVSSVGKTPSFSLSQVDVYVLRIFELEKTRIEVEILERIPAGPDTNNDMQHYLANCLYLHVVVR